MKPRVFTIYGERCSGTNFLEQAIVENFHAEVTWAYGWKHFFGFDDLSQAEDTLFVGIVRDGYEWINSLRRTPWHLQESMLVSNEAFLESSVVSRYLGRDKTGKRVLLGVLEEDKHLRTHRFYSNIFELRQTKMDFLMSSMPRLVRHYLLIRYEDLTDTFQATLEGVAAYLCPRKGMPYLKPSWNKRDRGKPFAKATHYPIAPVEWYGHRFYSLIKHQEQKLGYETSCAE